MSQTENQIRVLLVFVSSCNILKVELLLSLTIIVHEISCKEYFVIVDIIWLWLNGFNYISVHFRPEIHLHDLHDIKMYELLPYVITLQ